jgi:uncharacterized membrane protein (DUF2068 family)
MAGRTQPRRFLPRFHWELLACGVAGHELIGTEARTVRDEDRVVVREGAEGTRWYRCVRCDSWLPLPAPDQPTRDFVPGPDEVAVPLRGRALRDRIVLRLIAIDRALHFLVLGVLAVAVFLFINHRTELRDHVLRAVSDLQGTFGGPVDANHGLVHDIRRLFSLQSGTLTKIGFALSAYAIVEGVEAVGLWMGKRWAEYLTLIVTASFLPLEVYELSERFSVLKVITFAINIAVVVYLLYAKRLFGLRGGAAAEEAHRNADAGWEALARTTPA